MVLSDRSLAWLRAIDDAAPPADDAIAMSCALGLMAHRTPAWTERYVAALDRLVGSGACDSGSLLVALGIRSMITRRSATEPHRALAERTCAQWPAAVTDAIVAGLGLLLHDRRYGTDFHEPTFVRWWHGARDEVKVGDALEAAFYLAPQAPADARRLFDSVDVTGAGGPALFLAREWGLAPPIMPTDDGAFAAAAEACSPGGWSRLATVPLAPCPQIVGVDASILALRRAEWVDDSLYLELAPVRDDPSRRTSFRVVGAEPRMWYLTGIDGATIDVTAHAVDVRVAAVEGELVFTPGSY